MTSAVIFALFILAICCVRRQLSHSVSKVVLDEDHDGNDADGGGDAAYGTLASTGGGGGLDAADEEQGEVGGNTYIKPPT